MKWTVAILIGLGLLAAFCALILVNALRADKATARGSKGTVEVVVAKRPLPAMSVVSSRFIGKDQVPRDGLPEGFLTDPIQAVGKVLSVPMVEGQVLTKYSFVSEGTGAQLAAALPYGMRAVSVPIAKHAVMGGLLYPGCVVDVLATFRLPRTERGEAISTTLLHGVQVLAVQDESIVSKQEDEEKGKVVRRGIASGGSLTVTLMVDTRQAEALQLVMGSGKLSLAMRNPLDKKPVNIDATVLSQGRLAKLGSLLATSVPTAQQGAEWNGADPNLPTTFPPQISNKEQLRKFFSGTSPEADPWSSPQWQVTVIRGKEVKEEVLETGESKPAVEQPDE